MRSKNLFIFLSLFGLSLLFLLLFVMQSATDSSAALQVAGTLSPAAYLPIIQNQNQNFTPTPPPIDPAAPWIEESTITIVSYQYDHPDCVLSTSPGDFVYPYPRINHDCVLQKPKVNRAFSAITLHNSYVAVTVLPGLGGRLYHWQDKVTGRQLLYENLILKPTAWGWRGWWLASGGIEWAFPTDEHGLNEYRPWDFITETAANAVTITVSDVEEQTGMSVGVTVTLDADHSYMTLTPFVQNNTAVSHSYQYWLNAMIALNDNHVSDKTAFIVPASQVLVHSRDAAANYLPVAGEWMNWPEHNGRDFSSYVNWDHYLGFFAPNVSAGFSGVYDYTVEQGIVRVFDPVTMPGTKFFGPANLDSNLWTDDDSTYMEMWSSGVTPDFWTYVTLDAGQTTSWSERWYPVSNLSGFDVANEFGAMRLTETASGAEFGLQVTAVTSGTLSLLIDGLPTASWFGSFAPDQPFNSDWERPFGVEGILSLQLLDEFSQVLLETVP
ncbi:MAG: DUF5107 domain-containing protein [Chloroflexi bacterium]|nr:DUF5107 domain-containing protein [Chloroflexota bacterium]